MFRASPECISPGQKRSGGVLLGQVSPLLPKSSPPVLPPLVSMHSRFLSPIVALLALALLTVRSLADAPASFPTAADLPVVAALPDPLRREDGSPITDAKQWPAQRERMKAIIEHYALGHAPPAPGNVHGEVIREAAVLDGKATYRLIKLSFGPGGSLHLQAALFLPGDGKGIYPTVVQPAGPTPGGDPEPTAPGTQSPPRTVSSDAGAAHAAPILERGYALLTYDYQQAGLDRADNQASGFFSAYPDADWSTEEGLGLGGLSRD